MLTRLILWAINSAQFSIQDRALFTGALLTRLGAIDPCGKVQVDGVNISINGAPLTPEGKVRLRESAKAELSSFARKTVRDIVLEEAHARGFVSGKDMESILWARAAVWFVTREEELYKSLTQDTGNFPLSEDY